MSRVDERFSALLTGQILFGLVLITTGIGFLVAWLGIPIVELLLSQQSAGQWPSRGGGYLDWLRTLRWLAYIGGVCTLMGSLVFAGAKSVCLWCGCLPDDKKRKACPDGGHAFPRERSVVEKSVSDAYKAEE